MATSTQSPNDLTRQQLDELDDLLQRMLSLPLNPPESFSPPPPAQQYSPPMPTPAPAPVREAPVAVQVAAPAPRVFAPPAPEPVESPFTFKPDPMPAPVVERPAPAAPRPAVQTYVHPAPRTEPVPFLYAPFVGLNAILNWTLGLFGFPGRVLRSGFIKSLFGLAGIGLLAYTGLKVAQIHGLVTLPQELPWPR